jgi:hypothetical protein
VKLSEEQKIFIVTRLALHESPAEVREAFRDEYGAAIDSRIVQGYDASKPGNGRRIAKDLRELFERTRKEFEDEAVAVPIANKVYRLRIYDRVARRAMMDGNLPLAMEAAEKAAKETGGAFTNHKTLGGKEGGRPVPIAAFVLESPPVANTIDLWMEKHTPQGAGVTDAMVDAAQAAEI